ncbi:dTDP-4-dehydrorhamnose reductase [bacterium]|nr:dTDP-4-dehydrorhamnose reductase [bacterium]
METSRKILVLGSGGSLGSYIMANPDNTNDVLIGYNHKTLDVTNRADVVKTIASEMPNVVINASAYTQVDAAERDRETAFAVNTLGPQYMAEACNMLSIPLVHVSTDYVFGDNNPDGYTEDCESYNPLNIYGETKLLGELAIKDATDNYYIVRTSWLFGKNSKNFLAKVIALAKKTGEVYIVDDEVGCPTYVKDLSKTIYEILDNKMAPGIYHCCSSNSLSRFDFAKEALELMDIHVNMYKTSRFKRDAKVPFVSILKNTKLHMHRTSIEMIVDYLFH